MKELINKQVQGELQFKTEKRFFQFYLISQKQAQSPM